MKKTTTSALSIIIVFVGVFICIGCKKSNDTSNIDGTNNEVRVITYPIQYIDFTTAVCGGDAIVTQELSLTRIGVCWSTSSHPTVEDSHKSTEEWTELFVCTIDGLSPNTKYYVRAFAQIGQEYYYGNERVFNTLSTLTYVETGGITNITSVSAYCEGNEAFSDFYFIEARGVCWDTMQNPTIINNHTVNGEGSGTFATLITGLTGHATYFVRAYATTINGTFYGEQKTFTAVSTGGGIAPTGAINGLFSVSATQQVYFSQGNLQYIGSASTPYWKFADWQYIYLGTTTGQNSDDQNVDRDLFGWGTSGYNHGAVCNQPWSTSTTNSDYYAYGNPTYNLFDQTGQADWGCNPISNGGNQLNQWRTLTKDEWDYVFNRRSTPSGKRYALAKISSWRGVILLPDDWSSLYYSLNNINGPGGYDSNIMSIYTWENSLEQHGAVFLPLAGVREPFYGILDAGSYGGYWSAMYHDSDCAYFLEISDHLTVGEWWHRCVGKSVRLVQNYN